MRSIWSHVFVFYFVTVAFGVKFKKLSPRLTSGRLVPVFSSRGFMLSGLTSKSLIHGRSPVCKVEDGGLGSCPCGWPSRAPSAGHVGLVRLRPWAPHFVLCTRVCRCRAWRPSSRPGVGCLQLCSQDCFGCWPSMVPHRFQDCLVFFCETCRWHPGGDCGVRVDGRGRRCLSRRTLTREHGRAPLSCLPRASASLAGFIPTYFVLFDVVVSRIVLNLSFR